MAAKAKRSVAPKSVTLHYQLIRNMTSPDETHTGLKSFVANLPAFEILKLDTRDNLRAYIADYNPRKRNAVHDAIRATIMQEPQRFITRNSGFVVTAASIEIDDNKKTLRLTGPSIINGAQSQGEVKAFISDQYPNEEDRDLADPPFYVRVELIIDSDESEVTETAIARNTATPVKSISQAGARGHLDELEKSIQKMLPDILIRKSETDTDKYDTRKILQWARLLMPTDVSDNPAPAERLRAYKNPEQCLTEFSQWAINKESEQHARRMYDFTVQIAPHAIKEYEFWEKHDAWNGQRVWEETKKGGRACRRDGKNRICWVSPGLVFPIVGAMSEFTKQDQKGRWHISKPPQFKPEEMIKRAVAQFRAHGSDPMAMGRSEGAYDALRIYPQTLIDVMRDIETGS